MTQTLSKLYGAVLEGKIIEAEILTRQALSEKSTGERILNDALIPAMTETGNRFEAGEYYIPHMLIAAEAMKKAMEILKPVLTETGIKPAATVAIGTVHGDLHDIGKNLVASMLEGNGFKVINLGADVKTSEFTAAIKDHNATLIAMSALLTTTMINMKEIIDGLKKEGLREKVKIMIGGAPVSRDYAKQIGADGFSETASGAVRLAKKLILLAGVPQ